MTSPAMARSCEPWRGPGDDACGRRAVRGTDGSPEDRTGHVLSQMQQCGVRCHGSVLQMHKLSNGEDLVFQLLS